MPLLTWEGDTRAAKLLRVIVHSATPTGEREAAVTALARLEAKRAS